jgi:hypothetical protein
VKINVRQILVWLVIAFVIVAIWNSPTTTGNAVGDFFGALGSFIVDLWNKFVDFIRGMTQ